jgi:hypothetical protein
LCLQRNPKAPDFKHKIDNTALWIDSKYTPTWVKDRLEDSREERREGISLWKFLLCFFEGGFSIQILERVSFQMGNSSNFIAKLVWLNGFYVFETKIERHTATALRELMIY